MEVPCVDRADRRLVEEISSEDGLLVLPVRDDFDYVYRTEDLVGLSGRRFHSKKNHVNRFRTSYDFTYEPLTTDRVPACLALAEAWCTLRRCEEDMNLLGEWSAVRQALRHREDLGYVGGVIVVDGDVKAFSLGDALNEETGVVHIEKADPEIPELYAVINQLFAKREFAGVPFVNREQDLGEPGLRRAKSSYHPHHLEEKFRIRPTDGLWK